MYDMQNELRKSQYHQLYCDGDDPYVDAVTSKERRIDIRENFNRLILNITPYYDAIIIRHWKEKLPVYITYF